MRRILFLFLFLAPFVSAASLLNQAPQIIAAAVTPASFSNLELWLDPTDNAAITLLSGNVSQWNDESGVGTNATQSNATFRGTPVTSAINGKQVISFANAGAVNSGMTATLPTTYTEFTVGVLIQPRTSLVSFAGLYDGTKSTHGLCFEISSTRTTSLDAYSKSAAAGKADTGAGTIALNTTHWVVMTYSSTGSLLSIQIDNGTATTASIASQDTNATLGIFGGVASGGAGFFGWNGYVGDFVFYGRVLSGTELTSLWTSFIKPKWGL